MKRFIFTTNICRAGRHLDFYCETELKPYIVTAENVAMAIDKFADYCEKSYFTISDTAKKRPARMYRDSKDGGAKQIGLVFKASLEIEASEYSGRYVKRYVDIWAEINALENVDFSEIKAIG